MNSREQTGLNWHSKHTAPLSGGRSFQCASARCMAETRGVKAREAMQIMGLRPQSFYQTPKLAWRSAAQKRRAILTGARLSIARPCEEQQPHGAAMPQSFRDEQGERSKMVRGDATMRPANHMACLCGPKLSNKCQAESRLD